METNQNYIIGKLERKNHKFDFPCLPLKPKAFRSYANKNQRSPPDSGT